MQRRNLILSVTCLIPFSSHAQSTFIGQWQGEVDSIGKARLIITAIKPNGQVEGRMEFELQSFVSTFGDTADSICRGHAEQSHHGVAERRRVQQWQAG